MYFYDTLPLETIFSHVVLVDSHYRSPMVIYFAKEEKNYCHFMNTEWSIHILTLFCIWLL